MGRINAFSALLYACLGMLVKLLGWSETVFDVTHKGQSMSDGNDDDDDNEKVGRFTFDESPVFVAPTTLLLVHLAAMALWLLRLQPPPRFGSDGSGLGEIGCSVWVVLCLWPFVSGLFGKGKYGIPLSTICKSAALALLICAII